MAPWDHAPAGPRTGHRRDRALRLGCLIDSLVTGGAERLVVSFAEAVADRPEIGLTVFVLSDADTPFRREIEALGVRLVTLPGRSLVDPGRFARLVGALRRHRIEVLHAHLASATILGAAASAVQGSRFVVTVHNVRPSTRRVRALRGRLLRAALRANRTTRIAVGQKVAEATADEAGGKPFVIVPNAVPPSAVWTGGDRRAARRDLGLEDDDVGLIAVGLIIGQKGYADLIDAFGRIAARHPAAKLRIVGADGWPELKAELHRRVRDADLGGRVAFLGLRGDVLRLLAASDLFVSASHWEGAPVSLIEAMANGLPCLVTDVGDNARTLDGTGAAVVPPHDPEAFARALDALLSDDALRERVSAAVRRRAEGEFGTDLWVDRLLAIYNGLLETPRSGTTLAAEAGR